MPMHDENSIRICGHFASFSLTATMCYGKFLYVISGPCMKATVCNGGAREPGFKSAERGITRSTNLLVLDDLGPTYFTSTISASPPLASSATASTTLVYFCRSRKPVILA